jgi:hypothetical protein
MRCSNEGSVRGEVRFGEFDGFWVGRGEPSTLVETSAVSAFTLPISNIFVLPDTPWASKTLSNRLAVLKLYQLFEAEVKYRRNGENVSW